MQNTAFVKYNDETQDELQLSTRKRDELVESLKRAKEVN